MVFTYRTLKALTQRFRYKPSSFTLAPKRRCYIKSILFRNSSIGERGKTMEQYETKIIRVENKDLETEDALKRAVDLIKEGEVVAFPTETVYGLGANALNEIAVEKIFKAKNRPSDNPLICHVSSYEMLDQLVESVSPDAKKLIDKFWPGPLTILFPKKKGVIPDIVTCGLNTVAIRMPVNAIALSIIKNSNVPIAAPSANISGKPSPTNAQHVFDDMNGKIKCIVDGGQCDVGLESTVVDLNRSPPLILRPGGVTLEMLKQYIPSIQLYSKFNHVNIDEEKPSTPGLKYRHYSPNAKVKLYIVDNEEKYKEMIVPEIADTIKHRSVALITTKTQIDIPEDIRSNPNFVLLNLTNDPISVAHRLFMALRQMDEKKIDTILVEGIDEKDVGVAVMNRLKKAASQTFHIQ